jgi:hypothetical protein
MRADHSTEAEAFVVTSTQGNQHLRALPPLVLRAQRVLKRTPVVVVAVVVGLVTFLVHGYRLGIAPDIFSDEGSYLIVGINVARGIGLVENGSVFMWHSPAYMLVEATYIKLVGLTNADSLAALLSVRYLNIFFSAITAALLMLFGCKLHSYKAGLIAVALFLMDPYVQRINRRGMLETLAMLFVLLGLYIFFTHRPRLTKWQRLGSGIAFGLAMLTKEPMFLELLALIIYGIWSRRSQLRDVAWVAAIASVVYLPYPVWAVAVGQGNNYLSYKLLGIVRIIGSFTGHLPASPYLISATSNVPIVDTLWTRLIQYGMSYLLIALAAIFTVVLILRFRHLVAVRYLITLSIFSFGFGLTLGNVSDQYFYYLIVPSTLVVGYVLASLFETVLRSLPSKKTSILNQSRSVFSLTAIGYRMIWRLIFAVFFVILLYNGYVWTKTYAIGSDDAYINIIKYVRTHIPSGTTIVTSDDVALYFLSPSYNIRLDRDTQMIMDMHERYFIMSSKDAWGMYDATTPQFYDWVIHNSHPLFEQDDLSFWKLGVYQLMTTSTPTPSPTPSVMIHRSSPPFTISWKHIVASRCLQERAAITVFGVFLLQHDAGARLVGSSYPTQSAARPTLTSYGEPRQEIITT